jgi:hypothetical protein
MGFASTYLEERTLFSQEIKEAPDDNTGIIVVVPTYNEPEITRLLDSLSKCEEPLCKVEVIIVINAPENASAESIENNSKAFNDIESWRKQNVNCFFRLFAFIVGNHSIKGWGVGLARKTGMDEAVRRFNSINRPDGVILNLDADCIVDQNYFLSINNECLNRNDRTACSIYFEHSLSGNIYHEKIIRYITLYELHLRYYYQGLAYSGFPYVFHTMGSALAVKAISYVKAGGMNRRQAGEDFYFIQKLVPTGGYFNLNSTTVYPSPRISSRVPFGTGASIGKMNFEGSTTLLSYNIMAFKELRKFFNLAEVFFESHDLKECYNMIPDGLKSFIDETELTGKMTELKNNTSGLLSFKKRFFGWFNMFKIVKYLNFVHKDFFEKIPVEIAAYELLQVKGISIESKKPVDLLLYYRKLEKNPHPLPLRSR